MIKRFLKIWGFSFLLCITTQLFCALSINAALAGKIGDAIWHNECAKKVEGLVHWNMGEEFPSLGIGHFIWYPQSVKVRAYKETLPDLVRFINQSRSVPAWLLTQITLGAPWKSQTDFKEQQKSPQMQELRQFLACTIDLQVQFILKRLQDALPEMIKDLSVNEKALVHNRFVKLSRDPRGLYALADYLNFKGEGTSLNEQYNGTRWGLLQVLLNIDDTKEPLTAFVESAHKVLKARVQAAPKVRNEKRWLSGWLNRVNGYKTIYFA